jgi:hypothetical protein
MPASRQTTNPDADDGSITDGDDHTWLGDTKLLTKWNGRDGHSSEVLVGKRKREDGLTDDDQDTISEPQFEYVEDSADEEEVRQEKCCTYW